MIYLDNAATTKVMPEAADGVIAGMTEKLQAIHPACTSLENRHAERLVSFSRRKLLSRLGSFFGQR